MFTVESLYKSYRGTPVLNGIDLSLRPAETAVLIGPSGCGKSTLLRILLGLIRPDSGRVRFGNESLVPETMNRVRHRVGYLTQDGGLFPHMTAMKNIVLVAEQLRWEAPRIRARLGELVSLTRFPAGGLERYPAELSGGQRQRVALMRALMLDPEVLLLDEPLVALDPMVRYELQNDLRQVFADLGKTTLLVTHDLAEAAFFGDRLLLMREGRIVQCGPVQELMEHPADPFVTRFFQAQRAPVAAGLGARG
jgi:osmoprotectant transport system ATP-binding protein